MSLAQRVLDLSTRIATEFKTVKSMATGSNQGALGALTTTNKTSLLAAINEVNALAGGKIGSSEKGVANGVASLDAGGKVPAAQLPAYVDDVLEFANLAAFPGVGESGKLYLALDTGSIYRWSGSAYVNLTAASGAVASVFGRSGAVVAASGDYNALQVSDNSNFASASVAAALNLIKAITDNAVRFDAQALSAGQRTQVQTNIDVYSKAEIGNPETDFVAVFVAALA